MPQPPDRVEIRPAGPADAEALVDYMTALVAERLDTITRRTVPSVEQEREWIVKTAENPNSFIMI
ncbi:MAG TPA: hypothetical protein VN932_00615, partial [Rhizomicrobium sp.]|nr:hypothetical protein [Rhizomicrobium sp.]